MTVLKASGVASKVLGYGCPVAAAAVALVALYGPGEQDVSAFRAALAVFAAAAVVGAGVGTVWARAFWLSGSATGLLLVGAFTMPTAGSLAWLAAGFVFAGIVDAYRLADERGVRLGHAPWSGIAAGTVAFAVLSVAAW